MIAQALIDTQGTVDQDSDVVRLAAGKEHKTETGCLIAVYAEASELALAE